MSSYLIVDAGSTKTQWQIVSSEYKESFLTVGINALTIAEKDLNEILNDVKVRIGTHRIDEVFFYGAGCISDEVCQRILFSISKVLKIEGTKIRVNSDLLAAARSLLGNSEGIACIIGTGSNSCFYDGKEIVKNVPALGFILGDEGSGASLGKRLIHNVFKGYLSEEIKDKFVKRYGYTKEEIIKKVYKEEAPNRFLASLAPFLKENLHHDEIKKLIKEEFKGFFEYNIKHYKFNETSSLGFIGSIAFNFKNILLEVAKEYNFKEIKIEKDPMEGLIRYHFLNKS